MALNKRERKLAIVTAVLGALIAGKFLFSAWRGPVTQRVTERANLHKEVDRLQERVDGAKEAQTKLDRFSRRSLPGDPEFARSLYQNWLFELAEDVGFHGIEVDVTGAGRQQGGGGAYRALRFNLKGEASLDQLTEFLYEFYSIDHLHQIRTLSVKPVEKSGNLDVQLTMETLCLPDAQPILIEATEGSFPTVASLTPSLQTELSYTGSDGKLADAAKLLQLTGPEGAAEMAFRGGETLEEVEAAINAQTAKTGVAARVDGNRLTLRRKTAEADDAPANRLAATDLDRYREAIAKRNLFAAYKPPPPERPEETPPSDEPSPPKFDPCKYAYLTGIVGVNNEPELWLIARSTGTKYSLREGESFEVGDVAARVINIYRREAEIEFDGKRWLVPMGDNLREAKPLFEQPEEPADAATEAVAVAERTDTDEAAADSRPPDDEPAAPAGSEAPDESAEPEASDEPAEDAADPETSEQEADADSGSEPEPTGEEAPAVEEPQEAESAEQPDEVAAEPIDAIAPAVGGDSEAPAEPADDPFS